MNELASKPRLINDDRITLGRGGAMPITLAQQKRQAFIIIGLPASGKSGIANEIADKFGAVMLDSDYAKRKLPEFTSLPFGATLVHEESTEIIFGAAIKTGFASLLEVAAAFALNVVIPKIGNDEDGILSLVSVLKKYDYVVHLSLVELDRKKATKRALERFKESKRYVPLGLIFDSYSNNPSLTFHRFRNKNVGVFESFGIVSTDVPRNQRPKAVFYDKKNPVKIFK